MAYENQNISVSNGSLQGKTITFGNSNGVSFYSTNGSVVASFSGGTGGADGYNIIAAGTQTANTTGTIVFSNSNGITFGMSNSSIVTASHNGLTTARASNDAIGLNTAATNVTWTVNSSGISFNAGGYAGTGTSATNASITLNSNGLAISVGAGGGLTNINVSAGTTSNNLSNIVFSNSNGVTFGLNGSTVTASVNVGGGGAMTVSQFPLSHPPMATSSNYSGATTTTAGGSRTTVSLYVSPLVVDNPISFNRVFQLLSHATVAGTGSITYGNAYGLYTLNGGTALSLVSSFGFGFHLSQNSVTARSHYWYWGTNSTSNSSSVGGNISASVARLNMILYSTGANSLETGNYWLVYGQTQSSAGSAIGSFSNMNVSFSQSTMGSMFGTNVSSRPLLMGIASTTTTNSVANNVSHILPSSIATSAITGTGGSSQNRSQIIFIASQI